MGLSHSCFCASAVVTLLLARALTAQEHFAYTQPAMGTVFRIELYADEKEAAERAAAAAFKRIDEINAVASDYLPESELSRFNREPAHKPVSVSTDLFALIERSVQIARQTEGAFDITSAYAVQQWRRARRQKQLPSAEQTQKAIAMADWRALKLDRPARTVTKLKEGLLIDLGGIGKGYAADAALAVLRKNGITRALVAGSGDLAIGDPPPGKEGWSIALRTFEGPEESDEVVRVTLANCGCSTSGDLHQFLELGGVRYSHIVDPRTGLGLAERIACTVIALDAATSDALGTAMCVMGVERGLELADHEPGVHVRFTTATENSVHATASRRFPKPR